MFRRSTKGPIVPPEQNWAIGYIVDRVYNSRELTLDENLILLPDLMAYKEKRSAFDPTTIVGARYIYQAVILILACVTCQYDIRRRDVEAVGLYIKCNY